MKKQTRTLARRLPAFRRWAWLLLVPLLAGGCKPRDFVCTTGTVFQALNPEQGAGAAPFSIERLGPEVKALKKEPYGMILKSDNHARVDWMGLGHIYSYSDVLYSPAEGVARNVEHAEDSYPMRRSSNWFSERVSLGFRSTRCRDPKGPSAACQFGDEKLFLVAEMTCRPE